MEQDGVTTNPWMWLRMLRAAFSLSLRRLVRTPAVLVHVGIAAIPLLIVGLIYLTTLRHPPFTMMAQIHIAYEWSLRILYLHFVVFFIANILGFSVLRQEREEQTLHYLFLQPVRRWMFVCGKFLACLLTASVLCVASLWGLYLALGLTFCGSGAVVSDLFTQGRFMILARESGVLLLGLFAYGTFGLFMGNFNFLKSPAWCLFLLAWEAGLPYLPSTLKFWTIAHYLQSLLPERLTDQNNLFELLGETATAGQSFAVLLGVPLLLIGIAIWLFRYRECLYGEA